MRYKNFLAALLAIGLAACGSAPFYQPVVPVVPVVPPGPGPGPGPQPNPNPKPDPNPTTVLTFDKAEQIVEGLTRAQVDAIVGFAPTLETGQDDHTIIVRWPTVNAAGDAKWIDVQFKDGKVLGKPPLTPRVAHPPGPPVAAIPFTERHCCRIGDPDCQVPGR